jgi:hypothetical protein
VLVPQAMGKRVTLYRIIAGFIVSGNAANILYENLLLFWHAMKAYGGSGCIAPLTRPRM